MAPQSNKVPNIGSTTDFPKVTEKMLPLEDDLYVVGGRPRAEQILAAGRRGAYPFGADPGTGLWEWSIPEERALLDPSLVHMSKTTRQQVRKGGWTFKLVDPALMIDLCATADRADSDVTEDDEHDYIEWLDLETQDAYKDLGDQGLAYAIGAFDREGRIIGGLFGVVQLSFLTVESMFTEPGRENSGASKAALVALCILAKEHGYRFIDMQEYSDHLGTLGASRMQAVEFNTLLETVVCLHPSLTKGKVRDIQTDELLQWYSDKGDLYESRGS